MSLQIEAQLDPDDGYLVFVPRNFIGILAGLLASITERRFWDSDADYAIAYNTIARIRICMLDCPSTRLVRATEATYRLIDAVFNGTVYTVTSTEPLVVEPAIQDAPSLNPILPGNLAQLSDARDKLQAIIDAMATDDADIASIIDLLTQIGVLLA